MSNTSEPPPPDPLPENPDWSAILPRLHAAGRSRHFAVVNGGELHQLLNPLMRAVGIAGEVAQNRGDPSFVQYYVPPWLVADLTKEIWTMARDAQGKTRIRLEYLFQGFVSPGG